MSWVRELNSHRGLRFFTVLVFCQVKLPEPAPRRVRCMSVPCTAKEWAGILGPRLRHKQTQLYQMQNPRSASWDSSYRNSSQPLEWDSFMCLSIFLCTDVCCLGYLASSLSHFPLLFFSDVVFQHTIDGLSVLVPVAAVPGSQFPFSHPSRPMPLGCAYSSGNGTPAGLAGLFLLFLAANLWDLGFLLLPNENVAGGADLSSDL